MLFGSIETIMERDYLMTPNTPPHPLFSLKEDKSFNLHISFFTPTINVSQGYSVISCIMIGQLKIIAQNHDIIYYLNLKGLGPYQ